MRVYVGNQWQDNAVLPTGFFVPAASGTGTYCTITSGNKPVVYGVTPQPYTSQFTLITVTFYVYANAGVTGGSIQPQIQLADGLFRDYGPAFTPSTPGFAGALTIPTPVLGAQFNITSTITGGTVFLEIDGLLV